MSESRPATSLLLRIGALGGVIAVAANLALYGLGRATGASFLVTPVGAEAALPVGPAMIVAWSLVPLVLGLGATALAIRRGTTAVAVLQVLGVVVALGSLALPLLADGELTARLLLATMHVVVGAAYVAPVQRARAALSAQAGAQPEAVTPAHST